MISSSLFILSIFVIALVDAFFLSAFFLYGMLILGYAAALYAGGHISPLGLFIGGYLGSTLGSVLNFYVGRFFAELAFVKRIVEHPRAEQIKHQLEKRGLLVTITLGKFLGITRPVYGLILGALQLEPRQFLIYEWIIGAVWSLFWIMILVFGEDAISAAWQYF